MRISFEEGPDYEALLGSQKLLEADTKLLLQELKRFQMSGEARNYLPCREQATLSPKSRIVPPFPLFAPVEFLGCFLISLLLGESTA